MLRLQRAAWCIFTGITYYFARQLKLWQAAQPLSGFGLWQYNNNKKVKYNSKHDPNNNLECSYPLPVFMLLLITCWSVSVISLLKSQLYFEQIKDCWKYESMNWLVDWETNIVNYHFFSGCSFSNVWVCCFSRCCTYIRWISLGNVMALA